MGVPVRVRFRAPFIKGKEMKCFKCDKGLIECGGLFRTNGKGEPGIFACAGCNNTLVDPVVKDIVSIISTEENHNRIHSIRNEQNVYKIVASTISDKTPYHPV